MAITQTNKLGLPLYSAGTDPHPGRVDHNTIMQAINDNAMGVKQGLHASRPGAGVAGRTYFSTDSSTFSYDTGSTWADYVPIGGAAPSGVRAGATGPVLSGAGGTEGTSARLARADHTHALPLATDNLPGLLNADMYYLLARMTDAATPSTVVRRDSAARISVGTPTSGVHAATKAYADLAASNASNLTTGTVPVARLPLATASAAGAMSAGDKDKLDKATGSANDSTLVSRFADGSSNFSQIQVFNDPTLGNHGTPKRYVDGQFSAAKSYTDQEVATRAPATHDHTFVKNGVGTFGMYSNGQVYYLAEGVTKFSINSYGQVGASAAPSSGNHLTNKTYVDTQVATRALSSHNHSAADTISGVFDPARLPLATASAAGALSAADFALLAGATSSATPNTLVKNDGAGRFSVEAPIYSYHVANKTYVDNKNWSGADITVGTIAPERIANATNALDGLMPKADKAMLDTKTSYANASSLVLRNSAGQSSIAAPTSGDHIANKGYVDGKKWDGADITSGLINQARIANATSSLNGLMSSGDKSTLSAATGSNTGSAIVRRYSDGTFTTQQVGLVGQPTESSHAARKDYVDNAVNQFKPGAWVNANLRTGWEAHPTFSTPQFRLVNDTVELRGVARPTTGVAGDTIFSVPSAYIPVDDRALCALIGVQTTARAVMTQGSGTFYVPANVTGLNYVSLDGLFYNL